MPNTSSSVPFLLTSSMQSIRSRRPSACLSGSQGSGLLHQLSSGMVRHMPVGSGSAHAHPTHHWSTLQGATTASYNALQHTALAVRKCPSLNITLTRWTLFRPSVQPLHTAHCALRATRPPPPPLGCEWPGPDRRDALTLVVALLFPHTLSNSGLLSTMFIQLARSGGPRPISACSSYSNWCCISLKSR